MGRTSGKFHRNGRSRSKDIASWWSLMKLPEWSEYIVSVDNSPIWRRHIAWSNENGTLLRDHMTQRFASNMVFMSLLLSSEVGVLFSPSLPADRMRARLFNGDASTYDFWAGLLICISIIATLCTLVATFTAWAIVSTINAKNAHCIIRSSVGLYATQLPSRLTVLAIYLFLSWIIVFVFILVPRSLAIALTTGAITVFVHIVSVYSALGRLVMYTGAMADTQILSDEEEDAMLPFELQFTLLKMAHSAKDNGADPQMHYRHSARHRATVEARKTFRVGKGPSVVLGQQEDLEMGVMSDTSSKNTQDNNDLIFVEE
eukprot:scaffold57656_cov61-Attheya_sp.AAC.4